MISQRFFSLIVLALLPMATVLSQDNDLTQTIEKLDSFFEGWNSPHTPGCAVGVSSEGHTLVARAYGMADLEHMVPNTPSTIFEAGSVSKQFLTAAVVLLSLDGKLSPDDDVHTYIPELPDYGHTITIRHLMNHTSGLRDWGSVASISGWSRSHRTHTHDHVLDILSRQTGLNFPPGERYSYSNSGYNLMAVIVERVSGMPLAEFSSERIFKPLGMTATQWRDDYTRIVPNRSSAYSGRDGGDLFTINRPIEHVHGNGGLLTTVGDLLTWNHAIDTRAFGESFHREMHRQGVLNNGRTISYASGLTIGSDHGHPRISHTGATSGYRAYLGRFPDQHLSVAILCNVTGVAPGDLGSAVSGLFLDIETPKEEERRSEDISFYREFPEAKTGIYINPYNHQPVEIYIDNDTLRIKNGPRLIPVSKNRFHVGSSETQYLFLSAIDGEQGIQVITEGFEEELLTRVSPADAPDESNINLYTGHYFSTDAETDIHIIAENGELQAFRRPGGRFTLEPLYQDAFLARGFGLIRFFRDEDGVVTQFAYSSGRVYDMRFYREESPSSD